MAWRIRQGGRRRVEVLEFSALKGRIAMRARCLLAALLVVCCAGLRAQELRHDGSWWTQQTAGFRLFYIMGFLDGMALGNAFSLPDKAAQADRSPLDARLVYKERTDRYFSKVTIGELSDGLDTFYRDVRNRSILLPDAIDVVVRSISGEDVEKLLQAKRSLAAGK
jgi:hypothetical protein